MGKRIALAATLICTLFLALSPFVCANFIPPPPGTAYGTIYINEDGIKADRTDPPSDLPIKQSGTTYTLTGNIINYGFKIQCSNVILDGAGFTIKATDWYAPQTGVALEDQGGITIKNLKIIGFNTGILLRNSSNNVIDKNIVINSKDSLSITNKSTNNTFTQNQLQGSAFQGHGIYIERSGNNKFRDNAVSNGQRSYFWPSTNTLNFYIQCNKETSLDELNQDIDPSNTLDGKPMCYLVNQRDKVVPINVAYVALIGCSGITVQGLNLTDNGQGLLLASTTNSMVRANNITGNNEGIVILESSNNTFTDNRITRNIHGATFYSSGNTFSSNQFSDNERESANFQAGYINRVDISNTVNGSPLCYWVNQQDMTVPPSAGAVFLVNCSGIVVQNLTIQNQKKGLNLISTSNSIIINNRIVDNEYGICISQSSHNKIVKNYLSGNLANGIDLSFSSENVVAENQITQGYVGLYVANSTKNTFSRNNMTYNNYTGVEFTGSSNNQLLENRIEGNGRAGITLSYLSNNNLIAGNNVVDNHFVTVDLNNAQNNTFARNNFEITIEIRNGIYRTHQILDIHANVLVTSPFMTPSHNIWDNDKLGNYWSDYKGADANGDGIGDTPHMVDTSPHAEPIVVNGKNYTVEAVPDIDHYPLASAFNYPIESQLTVVEPASSFYKSSNVPLAFTVADAGLQVKYSFDQQAEAEANANTTLSGLSGGAHSLLMWTIDDWGTPANFQIINFNTTQQTHTSTPITQTTQSTQEPTQTASPTLTATDIQAQDYILTAVVLSILAVAVVTGVLAYFKRRK